VQVACPRLSIDWGAGFNKVKYMFGFSGSVFTCIFTAYVDNLRTGGGF
jgi:hypothetical protein